MERPLRVLLVLVVVLAAVCVVRLAAQGVGVNGGWLGSLGWPSDWSVGSIRLSRMAGGVAVGAALGGAGLLLQTLLRNPLASPDVIGVSAGASLAVMVCVYLAGTGLVGATILGSAVWQVLPACVGAMLVLGALGAVGGVGLLTGRGAVAMGAGGGVTLLLAGVVVSVLCGAGVMFLQYLMPDAGYGSARLLLGGLSDDLSLPMAIGGAFLVLVLVGWCSVAWGRTLDALNLPIEEALSVGVDVVLARRWLLIATGLLCSTAVALAGPVGFVGLIGPHVARRMMGVRAGHGVLLAGAAVVGAAVVVGADTLVRLVDLGGGRMPVGILTALVGGPLLIVLIRREAHAGR